MRSERPNYKVYVLVVLASFLVGIALLRDSPSLKHKTTTMVSQRQEDNIINDGSSGGWIQRPSNRDPSGLVDDNSYGPDLATTFGDLNDVEDGGGESSSATNNRNRRYYDTWETQDFPLLKQEQINTWTKYSRVCGDTPRGMTCTVAVNCMNVASSDSLIGEVFRRAAIHRQFRNKMAIWITIVLYFTKEGRRIASTLAEAQQQFLTQNNIKIAPVDWLSDDDLATIGNMGGAISIYMAQHALKTAEWVLILNSSYVPSTQVSRLSPPRPAAETFQLLTYFDVLGRPFPRLEDTLTPASQMVLPATTFLYLRRSKQTLLLLDQWKYNMLDHYKSEASRLDELYFQSLTLGIALNQLPTGVAVSLIDPSSCLYDHIGVDVAAHQEISGKRVMPSRFAFCDGYIQE